VVSGRRNASCCDANQVPNRCYQRKVIPSLHDRETSNGPYNTVLQAFRLLPQIGRNEEREHKLGLLRAKLCHAVCASNSELTY
jgi:hypothetical protein